MYDLEDRTFKFAQTVRVFVRRYRKELGDNEDIKQLIRSSGSIGANYIEANESLSKKDFFHRIKLCRKEAKETTYWLKLLHVQKNLSKEKNTLIKESIELTHIFGAIIANRKT